VNSFDLTLKWTDEGSYSDLALNDSAVQSAFNSQGDLGKTHVASLSQILMPWKNRYYLWSIVNNSGFLWVDHRTHTQFALLEKAYALFGDDVYSCVAGASRQNLLDSCVRTPELFSVFSVIYEEYGLLLSLTEIEQGVRQVILFSFVRTQTARKEEKDPLQRDQVAAILENYFLRTKSTVVPNQKPIVLIAGGMLEANRNWLNIDDICSRVFMDTGCSVYDWISPKHAIGFGAASMLWNADWTIENDCEILYDSSGASGPEKFRHACTFPFERISERVYM
jgi:hypothetical protein